MSYGNQHRIDEHLSLGSRLVIVNSLHWYLTPLRRNIMGKYFIAWLLGVPAFALLLFWLI